ncbi:MAG TPA: dTDP-4-amino-4,6-dideoxygalactose transaminase [Candidatus Acidoferrales bacterium]|nr:dTDP-4-amino-4,6-dideoxygalactose transaminase [Candidatus Acidoferrales bacterium]
MQDPHHIPFSRPVLSGNELEYMRDAVASMHISGDGTYTRKSEAFLKEAIGAARVLLTTNCTHALEMAALLLDFKAGDEVLLPAFTFVSTVNAFALRGAIPVFVDIRPDTLNIDERLIEASITPRTKAIVVVHYAGVACEMDAIGQIARRHGLALVEDNAHGLFASYRGKQLGSFGALATQSFHETKNFTCGEGGALVVNDERFIERAEIIREKGTNRSRFFRGQVDKYTWVDLGSSYVPSDMLAAFLLAQLEHREYVQQTRKRIWTTYFEHLESWAKSQGVTLPFVPVDREQSYHMFWMLLPTLAERTRFLSDLREQGVNAVFHYTPLHRSEEALRLGARGACPITESVSDRLVRLPFYNDLSATDQEQVIACVRNFTTTVHA